MTTETMTLNFDLELDIRMDGKDPGRDVFVQGVIDSLNNAIPSVLFDDDSLDCAAFVESFSIAEMGGSPASEADEVDDKEKVGSAPLSRDYDLLYDIKTEADLEQHVDYLVHRLAGIAQMRRNEGKSIDGYLLSVLNFQADAARAKPRKPAQGA